MNKRKEILEFIEDIELFPESVDSAIIGYVERAGGSNYVLYDKNKLIKLFKDEPLYLKEGHLYFTKATMEDIEKIDEGEMMIADGFNDAIVGYAEILNGSRFVIYDTEKCISILTKDFEKETKETNPEKSEEEIEEECNASAVEYFYYNTVGAYVGERTPGFVTILSDEQ